MIHVSGNKLAIDKNEVEWSFPEQLIGDNLKIVASEAGTYLRPFQSTTIIDHDFSGETIYFNPFAAYGYENKVLNATYQTDCAMCYLFLSTGGYLITLGGPPNVLIARVADVSPYPSSNVGDIIFNLYSDIDFSSSPNNTLRERTPEQCQYTLPDDFGKLIIPLDGSPENSSYTKATLDDVRNNLFASPTSDIIQNSSLLKETFTYDLNSTVLTEANVSNMPMYSSPTVVGGNRYARVYILKNIQGGSMLDSYNNQLYANIPTCPTVSSFATDSTYCNKLISHYYSTSVITNINSTNYLSNAEYGLTVSSSTTNLPISVTTTTRIHLKNKNFYYYNKLTSYPYIVQELTYLDSTHKGKKFERVINYKATTASSCDWGIWWETSAHELILNSKDQYIGGTKTFNGAQNFCGSADFTMPAAFTYSGIQSNAADSATSIWFTSSSTAGRPVKSDEFLYNPKNHHLQVGTNSTTNATVQIAGCNLEYNSSSKSLSFNFN